MKHLTEEEKAARKLERARYQKEYREKNKERRKEYTEKNRDHIRQKSAEWNARNAEKRKQSWKDWSIANAEWRAEYMKATEGRRKEYHTAYNATDKAKQARATYAAANKEKIKQSGAIYRSKPESKEKARIRKHKRRALEKSGKLSPNIVSTLLKRQKGKCSICKTNILKSNSHLDHVMPLIAGGQNVDSNTQLLCPPCNLSKGSKHPVDFMQSRGFLC